MKSHDSRVKSVISHDSRVEYRDILEYIGISGYIGVYMGGYLSLGTLYTPVLPCWPVYQPRVLPPCAAVPAWPLGTSETTRTGESTRNHQVLRVVGREKSRTVE